MPVSVGEKAEESTRSLGSDMQCYNVTVKKVTYNQTLHLRPLQSILTVTKFDCLATGMYLRRL